MTREKKLRYENGGAKEVGGSNLCAKEEGDSDSSDD